MVVCVAVFAVLERHFACNPRQPAFSKAMGVDLVYCALGPAYAGLAPGGAALFAQSALGGGAPHLLGTWLASAPMWTQVLLLLGLTDLAQYWLHRLFHSRWLWPLHAIHHSAEEVHWTTTFRVHPLNYLLYTTSVAIVARLLGFAPEAFLWTAPILFVFGALAHANLNWGFGPLRWLVVSPIFHRWHHSLQAEARDRNFAPLLPLWDLMFGTFHMPKGGRPEIYGVADFPDGLFAQFAHPFRPASWKGVLARSRFSNLESRPASGVNN